MANIESVRLPDGSEFDIVDAITPRTTASQQNLLINPWFTVNQREFTSGSSAGYTVDRWKKTTGTGTLTLTSNGLQFPASTECEVQQIFESMPWDGREITISLMYSDGTIVSGTDTWTTGGAKTFISDGKMIVGLNSSGNLSVKHSTSDANARTVRAIKLEIGSTSTIHLDTAPDYTTELLKCQRYYFRLQPNYTGKGILQAGAASSTQATSLLSLPVPMRTSPTISYSGLIAYDTHSATNISITEIKVSPNVNYRIPIIANVSGGYTAGSVVFINTVNASDYLALDAEL